MMSKLYLILGSGVLVAYMYTESRGKVFSSPDERRALTAEAKSGAGGYRSRSRGFWYVGGFRGGK